MKENTDLKFEIASLNKEMSILALVGEEEKTTSEPTKITEKNAEIKNLKAQVTILEETLKEAKSKGVRSNLISTLSTWN